MAIHTKLKKSDLKEHKFFFYGVLIFVVYLSYMVLKPYIMLTALAFITVVFFYPTYKIMRNIFRFTTVATMMTVLVIFISILIPTLVVGVVTYNQINTFSADITNLVSNGDSLSNDATIGSLNINSLIDDLNEFLRDIPGVEYQITEDSIVDLVKRIGNPIADYLTTNAISIGNSTVRIITDIIVYFTIVATLFPSLGKLINFAKGLSPLNDEFDDLYLSRIAAMSNAMIKGTFVIAIVQGVLSGLALWLVGIDFVLFFTLLSIFFSIIPIGAGIINIPIAIVALFTGNVVGGVIIILNNVLIVTQIDNYLRPRLVPKDANLHPTLTLLGVLGGIRVLGPFGFIFGPIIMIVLTTTIDIYRSYYKL